MGWMCSWIGVRGVGEIELLEALDLEQTGLEVEVGTRAAPFSYRKSPSDWIIVFAEDFEWATSERVRDLSRFGLAVGCQFEDKVEMTSAVWVAEREQALWSVEHANAPGRELEVVGNPPSDFARLRDGLLQEAKEDGSGNVDFLHDLPLELAKVVCGFRADDYEGAFHALRRVGGQDAASPPEYKTFLDRLLAPFRRR